MKTFSKLILAAIVLFAFSVVALWLCAPLILPGKIKPLLEEQFRKQTGGSLQIEKLRLNSLWPLQVELSQVKAQMPSPAVAARIQTVELKMQLLSSLFDWKKIRTDVSLLITAPSISYRHKQVKNKKENIGSPGKKGTQRKESEIDFDSALDLRIIKGRVDLDLAALQEGPDKVSLQDFDFNLRRKSLIDLEKPSQMDLKLLVQFHQRGQELKIPLTMKTSALLVNTAGASAPEILLSVAGAKFKFSGRSRWQPVEHQWQGKLSIPAMEKLPVPPEFLPPGQYSGGLDAELVFAQKPQSSPYFLAKVRARRLRGQWRETDIQGLRLDGLASLDMSAEIEFFNELKVKEALLTFDGSSLSIYKKEVFHKPSGVPLTVDFKGSRKATQTLIHHLKVNFWRLKLAGQGAVDDRKGYPSNLWLAVEPFRLQGIDKIILLAKNYPVQGQVSLKGQIKGDLRQPKELFVKLNPLMLKDVRASVNYKNKDQGLQLKGPLALNTEIFLEARGEQLKAAKIVASGNLNSLAISFKDIFRKPSAQPLSFSLRGKKSKNQVRFQDTVVVFPGGKLKASGVVANPQQPKLDLTVQLERLDFAPLIATLPQAKGMALKGNARGKVRVQGVYDFSKGIQKSPLKMQGDVRVVVPSYKVNFGSAGGLAADERSVKGKSSQAKPGTDQQVAGQPVLPQWPIIKNSKFTGGLDVGKMQVNSEAFEKLRVSGQIHGGWLSGVASMGNVFGGQIQAKGMKSNLNKVLPGFIGAINIKNIDLPRAVNFVLPKYKRTIQKGKLSGNFKVNSLNPNDKDFLKNLKVKGDIKTTNMLMESADLTEVANAKISEFLKKKSSFIKPTEGHLRGLAKIDLNQGVGVLRSIDLLFEDKNQLIGNGSLNLISDRLKFSGTAYFSKVRAKGCVVDGNLDSQNRLKVPLKVNGVINRANIGMVKLDFKTIAQNAAQCEKKRLSKKLKNQADEFLKKQADKLKGLFK